MTYKIGKVLENHFLKINQHQEYSDIVNIILDYIDEKIIECNEIIIGGQWCMCISDGNLIIKESKTNNSKLILQTKTNAGFGTTIPNGNPSLTI